MGIPRQISHGAWAIAMVLAWSWGCGSGDPANGTVKCALTQPQCPSDYVCYSVTNTCWKRGTVPDGGAPSVDGANAGEVAGEVQRSVDQALASDVFERGEAGSLNVEAGLDVAQGELDAPLAVDVHAVDVPAVLDSAIDHAGGLDVGRDAGSNAVDAFDYSTLSCAELKSAYASSLQVAQTCTVGASPVCTQRVPSSVDCGCSVFVDSSQVSALADLDAIKAAWTAKGCTAICPAIACLVQSSSTCNPASTSSKIGTCVGVGPI
jgi:hypothetical protein